MLHGVKLHGVSSCSFPVVLVELWSAEVMSKREKGGVRRE